MMGSFGKVTGLKAWIDGHGLDYTLHPIHAPKMLAALLKQHRQSLPATERGILSDYDLLPGHYSGQAASNMGCLTLRALAISLGPSTWRATSKAAWTVSSSGT